MEDRAAIMAWRRSERTRLLEARLRMPVADKQQASARIIENLTRVLPRSQAAAGRHHRQWLLASAWRTGCTALAGASA